jgi:hypothetical protein
MGQAKHVVVNIDRRTFTIEVDVSEYRLISVIITSLSASIREGFPIRIVQSCTQSLSKSQSLMSKIMSKEEDMEKWLTDVKTLLRAQQTRF